MIDKRMTEMSECHDAYYHHCRRCILEDMAKLKQVIDNCSVESAQLELGSIYTLILSLRAGKALLEEYLTLKGVN